VRQKVRFKGSLLGLALVWLALARRLIIRAARSPAHFTMIQLRVLYCVILLPRLRMHAPEVLCAVLCILRDLQGSTRNTVVYKTFTTKTLFSTTVKGSFTSTMSCANM
jgi:hypothetical protein